MFQFVFAIIPFLAASLHIALSSERRHSAARVAETYLVYFFFIYVGLMGLLTAYAHVLRPLQTSASIGWQPSPFEYEVGMADLTIGILGVLCFWIRGNFWLATAIANAVWLLGDAIGHIREIVLNGNHAANNAGLFLYTELAIPLLILLLTVYLRTANERAESDVRQPVHHL